MRSRVAADLGRFTAPALIAASAFAGAGLIASSPASAGGACTGKSGVTVVVDYPNGSAVGCAPGSPGTALNALRAAGFSTTGTREYGDAFLCSINSYPVAGVCPVTPSVDRTWYVFHAQRGGSWTFSTVGVTGLVVPPGGVVGFHYGTSTPPRTPVPGPISAPKTSTSHPTTPHPTTSHPATPKPGTATAAPSSTSRRVTSTAPSPERSATSQRGGASGPGRPTASQPVPSTSGTVATTASTPSSPGSSAAPARVKSTRETFVDGHAKKVVTFDDGSVVTLDANSPEAKRYAVGVAKESSAATAPSSTSVAAPSSSVASHPSISVSGSVPGLTVPEAKKSDDSNNLPGILAGVGVLGVAGVGAGVAAMRRRG